MSAERQHHPMSPSKWPKWVECPGYDRELDEAASEAMDRGTLAHALLEGMLKGNHKTEISFGDNGRASRAMAFVAELKTGCEWAASEIWSHGDIERPHHAQTEVKLELPGEYFGYADAVTPGHIWDLKTGRIPDAGPRYYEPQMIGYALALMESEMLESVTWHLLYSDQREHVQGVVTYEHARKFADHILEKRKAATLNGAGLRTCDLCSSCARRATCPALLLEAGPVIDAAVELLSPDDGGGQIASPLSIEMITTDPGAAGRFLAGFKALEKIAEQVENFARKTLEDGGEVPGFKLVKSRGPEFIPTDQLERWVMPFGFGIFLTAYGSMSRKKFEEIVWKAKRPNEPFPETIASPGKEIAQLRRVKAQKTQKQLTQ
jgi:hypothetical protein